MPLSDEQLRDLSDKVHSTWSQEERDAAIAEIYRLKGQHRPIKDAAHAEYQAFFSVVRKAVGKFSAASGNMSVMQSSADMIKTATDKLYGV